MSDLPVGWAATKLGDVTESAIDQGGPMQDRPTFTYIDISSIDRGSKRITNPQTLIREQAPSRARQRLAIKDVLVSMTRPNLNAVAIVNHELADCIGSTGFHVLRAKDVSPDWLYYRVQSNDFVSAMSMEVQGALYPAVRPKDITEFAIQLPPVKEQDRIVAEIEKQFSRLDAATAALKRVQANLKRYRTSALRVACEGRLVPTEAELAQKEGREYEPADKLLERILRERRARWEADTLAKMVASGKPPKDDRWKQKYKEPSEPHTSGLPDLPDGWCWASVEQLTSASDGLATGPFGTLISKSDQRTTGTPVVGIPNITHVGFLPGDWFHLDQAKALELKRYELVEGDVVVARSGTVGGACVIPSNQGRLIMSTNLMRMRTVGDMATWLVLNFKGNATIDDQLRSMCKGSTRPFLNLTILSSLLVRVAPTAEQLRIERALDNVLEAHRREKTASEVALRRCERLRGAILSRAFQGCLVSQNSEEQPASILLERIRAERAASAAGTSRRKGRVEHVHA
jgi:type I restriction enzyme S subunit